MMLERSEMDDVTALIPRRFPVLLLWTQGDTKREKRAKKKLTSNAQYVSLDVKM